MLDVCLLGCGGMMPLPNRWLTSLLMRYNGNSILIDCGEGTQIAMKKKGLSPHPIGIILFTHFHADHISGLPGLLLSMGNAERSEKVVMVGPKGLARVVNALRVIAPELPFEIEYIELTEPEAELDFGDMKIKAFRVNHNTVCYGYSLMIARAGKFDAERAKDMNIPLSFWSRLQKGEIIEAEGVTYTPDMVLGPARRGLKVTYCTDSRPTESISRNAADSDLFICEGMYGGPGMEEKAKEHKHMTFSEAAYLAKEASVDELWLTHYSPSLINPREFLGEAREIFKNTHTCRDGRSVELKFRDS